MLLEFEAIVQHAISNEVVSKSAHYRRWYNLKAAPTIHDEMKMIAMQ